MRRFLVCPLAIALAVPSAATAQTATRPSARPATAPTSPRPAQSPTAPARPATTPARSAARPATTPAATTPAATPATPAEPSADEAAAATAAAQTSAQPAVTQAVTEPVAPAEPVTPHPATTAAASDPPATTPTPSVSVDTRAGDMAGPTRTADEAPTRPAAAPADLLDRVAQAFTLHGYFRVRPEWQYNFALGWDSPSLLASDTGIYQQAQLPWPRVPDNGLLDLCSLAPAPGTSTRIPANCSSNTQTMANMRFRLQPEIHVTDNIAVYAQVDILDNLILGSTPQGYYTGGGAGRSPWAPITAFSQTQVAPTQANSLTPSVMVSRAWAEVTNPTLGQIRFGRMPSHWGLGMVANAGNGVDSDYQTHTDRLMYALRIKSLGLFAGLMYDFASTGATSASNRYEPGQGQPIDLSTLDDVNQYGLTVGHRVDAAEARQSLSRGDFVWNAGFYGLYRRQTLTSENAGLMGDQRQTDAAAYNAAVLRRDAQAFIGDVWFQLLHRNMRLEVEAAMIYGSTNVAQAALDPGTRILDIRQFGAALEFEYRLLNNRLQIEFRSGYATGDSDIEGQNFQNAALTPVRNGATSSSLFRFHPDYRVDLILWRQIFRQVSGAYYFRPGVMYAFVDSPRGDRLYGRVNAIWSRASEFVQTRGNAPDLGIELDAEVTYMSNWRDQTLGERPSPGFFASVQYGILFPMAGLGPRASETNSSSPLAAFSFSNAQTLRGVLGVMF